LWTPSANVGGPDGEGGTAEPVSGPVLELELSPELELELNVKVEVELELSGPVPVKVDEAPVPVPMAVTVPLPIPVPVTSAHPPASAYALSSSVQAVATPALTTEKHAGLDAAGIAAQHAASAEHPLPPPGPVPVPLALLDWHAPLTVRLVSSAPQLDATPVAAISAHDACSAAGALVQHVRRLWQAPFAEVATGEHATAIPTTTPDRATAANLA
jgi:hypothetical protein